MAPMQRSIARVGMLGLGSMGRPIAANVARQGFEVFAFDPRPDALVAAAEEGITGCASPAEVARQTDVALAIPYDYGQVEHSVFGPGGLAEGWTEPNLLVMMSTVGPDAARDLGRRLAERGHRLVDSPVSGGHDGATAGRLTLMVGAADDDLELCRPVLQTFSENLFHVGTEAGAGQAAKLVNQLLVVTHLVATAEALNLAARSGCDVRQIYDIISTSVGNSRIFGARAPTVLDRSFKTGGSLNILVKDARLVLGAGQAANAPLPLATAAAQVFEMARVMGLGDEDDAAVAKVYERICGQEIA